MKSHKEFILYGLDTRLAAHLADKCEYLMTVKWVSFHFNPDIFSSESDSSENPDTMQEDKDDKDNL
jgi:hypothetical protein